MAARKKKQTTQVKTTFGAASDQSILRSLSAQVVLDTIITPPDLGGIDRTEEDRRRYRDHLKKKVGPGLIDLVGTSPILGDKGTITVPVDGGYEPRFRFGSDDKDGGQGKGKGKSKGGNNPSAGDQPGEQTQIEIDLDELDKLLFENIDLPDLLPKGQANTTVKNMRYRGTQKIGTKPRLNMTATARARIKRAIAMKNKHPEQFQDETTPLPSTKKVPFNKRDFRYHRPEEIPDEETECVFFLLFDRSGSMSGEKLFMAKVCARLLLRYVLRPQYNKVHVVFITHDTKAYEIKNEIDFFKVGDGGGTKFSPAYKLARDIRLTRFPVNRYNAYILHATDGENFSSDVSAMLEEIKLLLAQAKLNRFCYLEIGNDQWHDNGSGAIHALLNEFGDRISLANVSALDELPLAVKEMLAEKKS